jgi:PhnB protein
MSLIPNYVPSGFKTINLFLTFEDADKAIDFYNRALGAEVQSVLRHPDTHRVVYAEIKLVDTIIIVAEMEDALPTLIHFYTGDAETIVEDMVREGGKVLSPVEEQFYGDRMGRVLDPFGHVWMIATHMEDLTQNQLENRFQDLFH